MTTVDYLSQIIRLERMISNKIMEIHRLELMARGLSSPVADDVKIQTSSSKDKMGDSVSEMEDEIESLRNLVSRYMTKRKTIIRQIDLLDNTKYYDVLTLRYVLDMSLEDIALRMVYSKRQVIRLLDDAETEFELRYKNLYCKSKRCHQMS